MSDAWRWEYDPDEMHVTDGIPVSVIAEVERLADQLTELADMGVNIGELGMGPRPGGLRHMNAAGGWFHYLASPRDRIMVVVRIVPPIQSL
ncbi:hypothetical protein AB0A70_31090 [Streptomyces morookaense]|uniref:hypothetical protein n=1 Tax=Streptomyces morookaense TaxID=1970 RepID=UPI0033DE9DA6